MNFMPPNQINQLKMDFLVPNQEQGTVPSEVLGSLVQIWEFSQRFAKQFGFKRFTVTQLYHELIVYQNSPQSDLADYLIAGLSNYIFQELVVGKNSPSNLFQLLEQAYSPALRKFIFYQTWPLFFTNLTKIAKLRGILQEDIRDHYNQLVENLNNKNSLDFRCDIILFLINWAVYEVESLGTELDETLDIMEEAGQPKKKSWANQLKKAEQELVYLNDQLKKEKRKAKKNKKVMETLINQIEEQTQNQRKLTKLLEYKDDDSDPNKCILVCRVDDIEIWLLEDDLHHIYLRDQKDTWTQIRSKQLIQIIEKLKDQDACQSLQDLLEQGRLELAEERINEITQWLTFGDEIESLIQIKFNLDFINRCTDLVEQTRLILLDLETHYSEYEIKYWKCNWTSKEKREIWRERVLTSSLEELQVIITKLPHQLSFVNRKHALTTPDPDLKYKSFRLYWFYQNKAYSQPYQSLSKSNHVDASMLYLLALTLYEKLTFYINKKITQIELNQIKQHISSQDVSHQMEEEEEEEKVPQIEEEDKIPMNRLRQRKLIKYDEHSGTGTLRNSRVHESSNSNVPEEYTGDRVLRQRKRVKYNC